MSKSGPTLARMAAKERGIPEEQAATDRDCMSAAGRDAPQPPAAVGHPETLPEVAEALLPSVYRGAAGSDLPDPADLARIDIPVRILAWVDDPSHPMSTATTLADVFGQSTLTVAESPRDVRRWPGLLLYDVSRLN